MSLFRAKLFLAGAFAVMMDELESERPWLFWGMQFFNGDTCRVPIQVRMSMSYHLVQLTVLLFRASIVET